MGDVHVQCQTVLLYDVDDGLKDRLLSSHS